MMRQKGRRVMSGIVSQREDIFMSLEPWHGKCVSLMKPLKSLHVPFSWSGCAPSVFLSSSGWQEETTSLFAGKHKSLQN